MHTTFHRRVSPTNFSKLALLRVIRQQVGLFKACETCRMRTGHRKAGYAEGNRPHWQANLVLCVMNSCKEPINANIAQCSTAFAPHRDRNVTLISGSRKAFIDSSASYK